MKAHCFCRASEDGRERVCCGCGVEQRFAAKRCVSLPSWRLAHIERKQRSENPEVIAEIPMCESGKAVTGVCERNPTIEPFCSIHWLQVQWSSLSVRAEGATREDTDTRQSPASSTDRQDLRDMDGGCPRT